LVATVTPQLITEPDGTEQGYGHDLWQYRELFQVLAWRDMVLAWRDMVIGAGWGLALLAMVIFTIVFGKSAGCLPTVKHPTRSWFLPASSPGASFPPR
jgi:hypothetical protein